MSETTGVVTATWPLEPDWPNVVRCPECGFDYVHLVGVNVYQLTVTTVVGPNGGTNREHGDHTPFGNRGSTAELTCQCESGHRFVLRFSFHKGNLFAWRAAEGTAPELWPDTELQRD